MVADSNAIVREYLASNTDAATLQALVGARIITPRLPQNTTLPALGFLTRGGASTPYIPGIVEPSIQFDCWDDNAIGARAVYNALYDALQGMERTAVVVGGTTYYILSAIEEVQGQDLIEQGLGDVDIPEYFRVLSFFRFMIRVLE